jgi:hypothetical protein
MNSRRILEMSLLAAIIGSLVLFLLAALERARVGIEEAAVQTEAAAIRVELLDRLTHRESVGGPLPQSANPLHWIKREPAHYLGELDAAPEAVGVWYFDGKAGALIYRFQKGGEARFRLTRGAQGANVSAVLGGVGLIRE